MSRLVDLGYAAGWSLIKVLPRRVVWAAFRAGADRAARKQGPGTQRLRRNLRQVIGPEPSEAELDLLVRDGLRSYARYWMEAFRLPALSREQILAGFDLQDGQLLGDAVAAGTGCVRRPAARRELGLRRRLGVRPRLATDHRRRAAEAGERLPALRRVPGGARHGDHPAVGRRAAADGHPGRARGRVAGGAAPGRS
jgi:hypothetical protein